MGSFRNWLEIQELQLSEGFWDNFQRGLSIIRNDPALAAKIYARSFKQGVETIRQDPSRGLDAAQLAADTLGFVPAIGDVVDIGNAAVSGVRGALETDPTKKQAHYTNMALSGAAAVPFLGWGAGATKLAKVAKFAGNVGTQAVAQHGIEKAMGPGYDWESGKVPTPEIKQPIAKMPMSQQADYEDEYPEDKEELEAVFDDILRDAGLFENYNLLNEIKWNKIGSNLMDIGRKGRGVISDIGRKGTESVFGKATKGLRVGRPGMLGKLFSSRQREIAKILRSGDPRWVDKIKGIVGEKGYADFMAHWRKRIDLAKARGIDTTKSEQLFNSGSYYSSRSKAGRRRVMRDLAPRRTKAKPEWEARMRAGQPPKTPQEARWRKWAKRAGLAGAGYYGLSKAGGLLGAATGLGGGGKESGAGHGSPLAWGYRQAQFTS